MEPDDIGVVMTRASELHGSICDAIDRVSKSRLLGDGSLHSFGDDGEEDEDEDENEDEEERGVPGCSSEEEVRSLEGIREALEILETQLESLQSVQQQQRIRKNAALAELEESRRVLLLRLKEHDGREMQVVEEAMAFAGEPVKKNDDLPLPPYLHPVSPSIYNESPVFRTANVEKPNLVKQLEDRCSFNDRLFLVEETVTDSEAVNTEIHIEEVEELEKKTSPPSGRFSRVLSGVLGVTGKTLLVVVSVVAFWAVSDLNIMSTNGRKSQKPHEVVKPKPPSTPQQQQASQTLPPQPEPKPAPILECPAGYKRIEDDGIAKCIVKERVELPFPRRLSTPDVLHGRG